MKCSLGTIKMNEHSAGGKEGEHFPTLGEKNL